MKTLFKSVFILFVLLIGFAGCSEKSIDPGNVDPDNLGNAIKILFIGNSYTYYHNMPQVFDSLATRSGKEVYVDQSIAGGKQVTFFVNDSTTHQKLRAQAWDYIVFQQFQLIMESEDRLWQHLPKAVMMDSIIHYYQPQAKTVLFMEQAYEGGDETYDRNDTFLAMTERVKRGSISFARQMGTHPIIAPVAVAWGNVFRNDNTIQLHEPNDGAHPSIYGAYITACVFYSTIFKENISTNYYNGLSETFGISAQQTASSTVLDSLALWNNN
ncbi:MAG: hypothetical protein KKA84_10305 [Bacteroidetes bacterium]|nr:hypothetical protein [Bacteroidota bacterium]